MIVQSLLSARCSRMPQHSHRLRAMAYSNHLDQLTNPTQSQTDVHQLLAPRSLRGHSVLLFVGRLQAVLYQFFVIHVHQQLEKHSQVSIKSRRSANLSLVRSFGLDRASGVCFGHHSSSGRHSKEHLSSMARSHAQLNAILQGTNFAQSIE